jgi:hypothetical protein
VRPQPTKAMLRIGERGGTEHGPFGKREWGAPNEFEVGVSEQIIQFVPVLLIPTDAAVLGFFIGRLIRGRPPRIEIERPRIAISSALLRDARNEAVSLHTRTKCAYESIYFCCCEMADTHGLSAADTEHTSDEVIQAALSAMSASNDDCQAVKLLADWVMDARPSLPSLRSKMPASLPSAYMPKQFPCFRS